MRAELSRLRATERSLARVRILAFAFAVATVAFIPEDYPDGYRLWAWALTAALGVGTAALYPLAWRDLTRRGTVAVGAAALAFDTAVVYLYTVVFAFEPGTPSRAIIYLAVVEAALRYGVRGGVALPLATAPLLAAIEWFRSDRFEPDSYDLNFVVLPVFLQIIIGVIVGRLVATLRSESARAEARAGEAEELRDRLGRRADLVDAANRCARALSSSLELEPAYAAFVRELRGLVPFDRAGLVLADEGSMRVMAVAGTRADDVRPLGTLLPAGTLLERIVETGQTVYRRDMGDLRYPEEADLVEIGLHSRILAPLLLGPRVIGMLSVSRTEPDSFGEDEVELVTHLGRLVASAVQNIRAFEGEHRSAEELRRLSALRADFVSLVSHELRSPMAAVLGAARTLEQRGDRLTQAQRDSFLGLIAEETERLATLVSDVLDTSRIEAGTFSYSFSDVHLGEVLRDAAASVELGQAAARVDVTVAEPLPAVRGDRERLRQVVVNLLENAVKYSEDGARVDAHAFGSGGRVLVEVRDRGPGVPTAQQKLIFEKFGRAQDGQAKPGTGLGLYIARSIAEAHGGTLVVRSAPPSGATFTLTLPL